MPAYLVSTSDGPLPAEAAIVSFRALPSLFSSGPSDLSSSVSRPAPLISQLPSIIAKAMSTLMSRFTQHTSSSTLAARLASSSSPIVKRYSAYPLPTALSVILVILSLLGILLALRSTHYKYKQLDVERVTPNWRRREPISDRDFRSNLLTRTATSRLGEDWQQGVTKPPPAQNRLSRRDSAVLFDTSAGSRLSSEPSLSAHDVEASGVLGSDIANPPPTYAPRRV